MAEETNPTKKMTPTQRRRAASATRSIHMSWHGYLVVALSTVWLVMAVVSERYSGVTHFYNMLSSAMLNGRLGIDHFVPDSVPYHGHYYLTFGPLPALLVTPLVLLFGQSVPALVLSGPAMIAITLALPRLWRALGVTRGSTAFWLSVLTLAGTILFSASLIASDYFTAHVVVDALLFWALTLALQGRLPVTAGVLVGCAALTRSSAAVAAVPIALIYLSRSDQPPLTVLARLFLGLAPLLLLLAAYNWARFGSPIDSGYAYQALDYPPLQQARSVALFGLAHLPKNLYYFLVAGPLPTGGADAPTLSFPWLTVSPWGLGLLWVSPWLFIALAARGRLALLLAAGATIILLPSLLFYGIGWIQFGYRYGLDALPFLAALTALAVTQRDRSRWLPALAGYSIAVNVAGSLILVHWCG